MHGPDVQLHLELLLGAQALFGNVLIGVIFLFLGSIADLQNPSQRFNKDLRYI